MFPEHEKHNTHESPGCAAAGASTGAYWDLEERMKMGRTCSGQAPDGLGKTLELSLLLNASYIQVVALVLLLSTEGV